MHILKKKLKFSSHLLLILFTCSCFGKLDSIKGYDPETGLSRGEIRDKMLDGEARRNDEEEIAKKLEQEEMPEIKEFLNIPEPPKIAPEKLISLSITEDVPLKTVLIELGRLADVEMEIDPRIVGGIIMIVKDRPFDEVIRKIADMANLRYSVDNGLLKIQMDTPYIVNYNLKFLDMIRTNSTSLDITTTTGNDDLSSGGTTSISTTSVSDIWKGVKANIQQMIDANDFNKVVFRTALGEDIEEDLGFQFVTINPQAGVVSVKTSQRNHENVENYLGLLRRSLTSQVLIEAKIVEVLLDDQYKTGVEWSGLSDVTNANFNSIGSDELFFGFNISDSDIDDGFNVAVSLLDKFGTTRTLSSPRITALNNQQSVLSFTENKIYFEVEYDEETVTGTSTTSSTGIDSTLKTLPVGIIVTMLPSIDFAKKTVTLNIRPTISTSTTSVSDPAVELISLQISEDSDTVTSDIPEVSVKEIDTILNVKDKQIIVMGGLIDQIDTKTETGVPVLKDIPYLGTLFRSYNKEVVTTETVLFIKATIIDNGYEVDQYDQDFYNSFTTDPRPLIF